MLTDQVLGCFYDVVGKAEALEHCPGHLRALDLVAIEVRTGLRPRLADVVEQGCQAEREIARRRGIDRGQAMLPHVVGMPLILLDPDAFQKLRPEIRQYPGLA